MTLPSPIRVIGCGSPLGDDAVGWELIRYLRQIGTGSNDTELHAVSGGDQLLDKLDSAGTLLLIDAVRSGAPPGTIHRMEWPDKRVETLQPGSTHQLGPSAALRLAETLGLLPRRVIVFGVEAGAIEPAGELSEPVTAIIPHLAECINEEIADARNVAAARSDSSD